MSRLTCMETSRLSRWQAGSARLTASASLSDDTLVCMEKARWSVWILPSPVTCFDKFRARRGGVRRTPGKQTTERRPPPPDGTSATSATRHDPCGRVPAVSDQPQQTAGRWSASPPAHTRRLRLHPRKLLGGRQASSQHAVYWTTYGPGNTVAAIPVSLRSCCSSFTRTFPNAWLALRSRGSLAAPSNRLT